MCAKGEHDDPRRPEGRRPDDGGFRLTAERLAVAIRLAADHLAALIRVAAEYLAGALQGWARRSPSEHPDPATARTTAEFAEQLRRLKRYRGASYREMARLSGGTPVVSTLSKADKGDRLPSERVLRAYLRGCHLDDAAMTPWLEARGRLAMRDH
ncbi:helix-turn-helix domain-containing protein [Actinomadura harenae]|uniref:XRE family transcriptional regulator n=1 Tax=Actinomadura harenae TaxID=2483351 RepID=A0A3M2M809_9ACTN|nr:helix-turn-helix transcriptional regulator [Actinomadura harenae]RMI44695.1 XRE family transcriptional regulator [Actinomadura harenae]